MGSPHRIVQLPPGSFPLDTESGTLPSATTADHSRATSILPRGTPAHPLRRCIDEPVQHLNQLEVPP